MRQYANIIEFSQRATEQTMPVSRPFTPYNNTVKSSLIISAGQKTQLQYTEVYQ